VSVKLKGVQFIRGVRFYGEAREMVSPQNPRLEGIEIGIDFLGGGLTAVHLFAPRGNNGKGEHRWVPLANVVSFVLEEVPQKPETRPSKVESAKK